MPTPLIPALELIKSSWQAFTKSWEALVRYSAWLILPAILALADLAIPAGQDFAIIASAVAQVTATIAVSIWVSVALYQVVFATEKGEKVSDRTTANAWQLVLPLLVIGLLQGLATMGALLLLILPGIYVGVRLGFSQLTLFSKNLRGRAALADSWALTKNRFWAVLWRQIAGAFVFGILVMIVTIAAMLLVGIVAGGAKVGALLSTESSNPLATGILDLIQSIIQAAFIPLFIIYQVKLYKALEKTR
ncbi:MAG TPA: hypothetical protein VN397_00310 [Candidatus Methylomirabilis sp.]|nr:hypothetical protein [Candidatus Methylomirabilis sp.]